MVTRRDASDGLPANTRTPAGGGTMTHSGTFRRQPDGGVPCPARYRAAGVEDLQGVGLFFLQNAARMHGMQLIWNRHWTDISIQMVSCSA